MNKNRLEAFSDGVIAIIITIMVLELKVPHGTDFAALRPTLPTLLCYILSFLYVGIYWNNHHHLLHAIHSVNGAILWANQHLLFWLSLQPFVTAWVGQNPGARLPCALYGVVLFMAGAAYRLLVIAIIRHEGKDSKIARAVGRDFKGMISVLLYIVGVALAFASAWPAYAVYAGVALIWLIPDRRFEGKLAPGRDAEGP
jgi:uncharacterized membrane protein